RVTALRARIAGDDDGDPAVRLPERVAAARAVDRIAAHDHRARTGHAVPRPARLEPAARRQDGVADPRRSPVMQLARSSSARTSVRLNSAPAAAARSAASAM